VMVRRRMMVQAEHSALSVRYDPVSCQTRYDAFGRS
jgi:hypothetical protein